MCITRNRELNFTVIDFFSCRSSSSNGPQYRFNSLCLQENIGQLDTKAHLSEYCSTQPRNNLAHAADCRVISNKPQTKATSENKTSRVLMSRNLESLERLTRWFLGVCTFLFPVMNLHKPMAYGSSWWTNITQPSKSEVDSHGARALTLMAVAGIHPLPFAFVT